MKFKLPAKWPKTVDNFSSCLPATGTELTHYQSYRFYGYRFLSLFIFCLTLISVPTLAADTDGDGLDDSVETNTGIYVSPTDTGTDPAVADTDADGFNDGDEVSFGTDPNNTQQSPITSKLTANDAQGGDHFGSSAAVDGDTAVIGAPLEDTGGSDAGAVYVYTRSGGVWSEQQKLTGDVGANDQFGISVSVSGDTIVVGAARDDDLGSDSGAAYVFTWTGGVWSQQQKLNAVDAGANDRFGNGVSVSGDTVLVGAPLEDDVASDSGAAYVFTRSGGVWSQQQKLKATDAQASDLFGGSVSVSGDFVVTGALGEDAGGTDAGAAYVFVRNVGVWSQQQKLTADDDAEVNAQFGRAVSISGDTVVSGAFLEGASFSNAGAAYVFDRNEGGANNWGEVTKLTASDAAMNDQFGFAVSVSGDSVVIGAVIKNSGADGAGAVYVFDREQGGANNWGQVTKVVASDAQLGDQLGYSVAVSGDTMVSGARREDDGGSDAGAAYIYDFDVDDDGLQNSVESNTGVFVDANDTGTDPLVADSDLDGLSDGDEVNIHGSNPFLTDTDSDGLSDAAEISAGTNPLLADTDADGLSDAIELEIGTDPLLEDSDADGLLDGLEMLTAKVFVTDSASTGNLGGLAGADAICDADASAAGIGSGFKAWLSTSTVDAKDRIFDVAYERTDGALVANDLADLLDGSLSAPISYTAAGVNLASGLVHTGTTIAGVNIGNHCLNWTDGSAANNTNAALMSSIGTDWTDWGVGACSISANHYCFGLPDASAANNPDRDGDGLCDGSISVPDVCIGGEDLNDNGVVDPGESDPNLVDTDADGFNDYLEFNGAPNNAAITPLSEKLLASDGGANDRFGDAISVDGSLAAIGAPQENGQRGAVYIFSRVGGNWVEEEKLVASDGSPDDFFGSSVSIDRSISRVVIGAPYDDDPVAGVDAGSVYIFTQSAAPGNPWAPTEVKLTASDAAAGDFFGISVDYAWQFSNPDRIIVGAHGRDTGGESNAGAAYIFDFGGSVWTERFTLEPILPTATNRFGAAVAMEGDTALVGADLGEGQATNSGTVFAFQFDNTDWNQIDELYPSDIADGDRFGGHIDFDGSRAIVGAYKQSGDTGAAYIFEYSPLTLSWEPGSYKLSAGDATAGDRFGWRVAIDGGTAVVGAYTNDDPLNSSGSTYAFVLESGTWQEAGKLLPFDLDAVDEYGFAVDISDSYVFAASHLDDDKGSLSGSVYSFRVDIDIDNDGLSYLQELLANTDDQNVDSDGDGSYDQDEVLFGSDPTSALEQAPYQKRVLLDGLDQLDVDASSVAVSGDVAFIGFNGLEIQGENRAGAVYRFERVAGVWQQMEQIIAPDFDSFPAGTSQGFGASLALDGATLVVGAPGDDTLGTSVGAAYVFEDIAGTWTYQQKLLPPEYSPSSSFANDVDIEGDRIVAGAPCVAIACTNVDVGKAFVFERTAGVWDTGTKLDGSNVGSQDWYGLAVAIDGDRAIIGSPLADALSLYRSGTVHVFIHGNGGWEESVVLNADQASAFDQFGFDVALNSNNIIVGMPYDNTGLAESGSVQTFKLEGDQWILDQKLLPPVPEQYGHFGRSLNAMDHAVVIGSDHVDDYFSGGEGTICELESKRRGEAFVFTRSAGSWSYLELEGLDTVDGDAFGWRTAIGGNTAIVTSNPESTFCTDGGFPRFYFFDLDLDDDGLLNGFEVSNGFDPNVAGEEMLDGDADNLDNLAEQLLGSNPTVADTDGDSFNDDIELARLSEIGNANDTPIFRGLFLQGIAEGDATGKVIAVDGNWAVVGAPSDDGDGFNRGAAYILKKTGEVWQLHQKWVPMATDYDLWGVAVDISGDTIVVGSDDEGAQVLTYDSDSMSPSFDTWVEDGIFTEFLFYDGSSISVDGDYFVMGAPNTLLGTPGTVRNAGEAHVYKKTAGVWGYHDTLQGSESEFGDRFGHAVAIDGNFIVVSAPQYPDGRSIVTAYERQPDDSWDQIGNATALCTTAGYSIVPSNCDSSYDFFGISLAIDGDLVAIGTRESGVIGTDAGSVHMMQLTSAGFTRLQEITGADTGAGDQFGGSVSIAGNSSAGSRLVVGAPFYSDTYTSIGSTYVYNQLPSSGGPIQSWTFKYQYSSLDGVDEFHQFGTAVAQSGDELFFTAPSFYDHRGKLYIAQDDEDDDLVTAATDNCPSVSNTDQANSDGDELGANLGDVCDLDDDMIGNAGHGQLDLATLPSDIAPETLFTFTPNVGYAGPWPLCFEATGLPAWAAFDATRGSITGTPLNDNFGISSVELSATEVNIAPAVAATNCLGLEVAGGQSLTSAPFDLSVQDTRAPTVIATPVGANSNVIIPVTLTCVEAIGSGCAEIYTAIDAPATVGVNPVGIVGNSGVVNMTTSGDLNFIAVDVAGNASDNVVANFTIDTTAPLLDLQAPVQDVTTTAVAFAGAVSDAGTGVASVSLSIDETPVGGALVNTVLAATVKDVGSCSGDGGDGASAVVVPAPCWEAAFTPASSNSAIDLTVTATDNASNSTQVNSQFLHFSQTAFATTVNLSLDSNSIPFGGEVTATVDLSMSGTQTEDLNGLPVTIKMLPPATTLDPTPTVIDVAAATGNSDGQVSVVLGGLLNPTHFQRKGTWSLWVEFGGSLKLQPVSSSAESLLVNTSAGYAVLIQGQAPNGDGLDSHNKTLNRVYETLKRRNFQDEDIFYFNYNPFQNGIDYSLDFVGKAALQELLEGDTTPDSFGGASDPEGLADRMSANPAPLYIVMVDHGNTDGSNHEFIIDNNTDGNVSISPTELDTWLDSLEGLLTNGAELEPRVIINGSCYSGGFIDELTGPSGTALATPRIAITSAAADEVSYKGPLEADNIRVGEYFVEELFGHLDAGDDLLTAFQQASEATELFTLQDGSAPVNGEFLDRAVQHPLMCDNGDGQGSNVVQDALFADGDFSPNPGSDGQYARSLYLGTSAESVGNSLEDPARFEIITPTRIIDHTTSNVELYGTPVDNNQVANAFIELRSPDDSLDGGVVETFPGSGIPVTEQLEAVGFDKHGLIADGSVGDCNPDSQPNPTWCRDITTFTDPGKYEVYYFAEDSVTGEISEAKRSVVYKRRDPAHPTEPETVPAAFDLTAPSNASTVNTNATLLQWQASSDVDGFTYTVRLCENTGMTSNCRVFEEVVAPFTSVVGLKDDTTYYWEVDAIDNFGATTTSTSQFSFAMDLNGNNIVGVMRGFVQSGATFSTLNDFAVSRTAGTSNPLYIDAATDPSTGFYELLTIANTAVPVEATALGYQAANATVMIPASCSELQLVLGQCNPTPVSYNFLMDDEPDTDSDGVSDATDNCPAIANPAQTNTDGDSEGDACDSDDDNDGMSDVDEVANGLNPLIDDASGDLDGDGLTNSDEVNTYGTFANNADSEGDGMDDGWEISNGLDPLTDDAAGNPDGDEWTNGQEYVLGLNPNVADEAAESVPLPPWTLWLFSLALVVIAQKTHRVIQR